MLRTYPIFLVGLARKRCVVIGGGQVAEGKVERLLQCDASVTLVAPTVTPALRRLADGRRIDWRPREYRSGDVRGAFLAIAAAGDPDVRAAVWAEAESEGALICSVDDAEHSNFIAGSVVRRGPLTVAISTGGCSPALAVRLRERLERELGAEYDLFLRWMRDLRESLVDRFPDAASRREIWYRLVDSEALDLIRRGLLQRARNLVEAIASAPASAPERRSPSR